MAQVVPLPSISADEVQSWFSRRFTNRRAIEAIIKFAAEANEFIIEQRGHCLKKKVRRRRNAPVNNALILLKLNLGQKAIEAQKKEDYNKSIEINISYYSKEIFEMLKMLKDWGFLISEFESSGSPSDIQQILLYIGSSLMRIWNLETNRKTVTIGKDTPLEVALHSAFCRMTGKSYAPTTLRVELGRASKWGKNLLQDRALPN